MPLTESGKKVLKNMVKQYGSEKGKNVFYASENKGIKGSGKWTSPDPQYAGEMKAKPEDLGLNRNRGGLVGEIKRRLKK